MAPQSGILLYLPHCTSLMHTLRSSLQLRTDNLQGRFAVNPGFERCSREFQVCFPNKAPSAIAILRVRSIFAAVSFSSSSACTLCSRFSVSSSSLRAL